MRIHEISWLINIQNYCQSMLSAIDMRIEKSDTSIHIPKSRDGYLVAFGLWDYICNKDKKVCI